MQSGKRRAMREHTLNQAIVIWGSEELDIEAYLTLGAYHKQRTERMVLTDKQKSDVNEILKEAKEHGGIIQVKPRNQSASDSVPKQPTTQKPKKHRRTSLPVPERTRRGEPRRVHKPGAP